MKKKSTRCYTTEYRTWSGMRSRCNNPSSKDYPRYGGRGITVCERWNSYDNFLADMGHKPSLSHTIERRDNSKGYSPDNCYWATMKQQMRNKRNSHLITRDGQTMCASDWCLKLGINHQTFKNRIGRCGWTVERALGHPSRAYRTERLDLPVTIDGRTLSIRKWLTEYGVNRDTYHHRVRVGMSPERALKWTKQKHFIR